MSNNVRIIPKSNEPGRHRTVDAARAAEKQRIDSSIAKINKTQAVLNLPSGNKYIPDAFKNVPTKTSSTVIINSAPRTTAGVTPKTSTVAKLFRPFKGSGIGGIMGNKQR